MTLFDDNTAQTLDSATTTLTEQSPPSVTASVAGAPAAPQPAHEEKPSGASGTDDFASALESFNSETEETSGDDRVLKGTVLKLTSTHVVVDIGAKSEGMLPLAEVLDQEGKSKFQPGDEIAVMREKGETEEGYINLSHQKAQRLRAWDEIERAYNKKKPIHAIVVERIKGGLTVTLWGHARSCLALRRTCALHAIWTRLRGKRSRLQSSS